MIDFVLFSILIDQRTLIEKSFLKGKQMFQKLIFVLKEKNNFTIYLV
jgi:hypothetical protein